MFILEDFETWFSARWTEDSNALDWFFAGWDDPHKAYSWYSGGWKEPELALSWHLAGWIDPKIAFRWYSAGWKDPKKAFEWYSNGWGKEDPSFVLEWVKAGWDDPKKALPWRGNTDAVVALELYKAGVLTPQMLEDWKVQGFYQYYEVIAWGQAGFDPINAKEWAEAGWTDPEEAMKWFKDFSVGPESAKLALLYSKAGMNPEEAKKWYVFFKYVNLDDAVDGILVGIDWYRAGWRNPFVARKWFDVFGNKPKLALEYYNRGYDCKSAVEEEGRKRECEGKPRRTYKDSTFSEILDAIFEDLRFEDYIKD